MSSETENEEVKYNTYAGVKLRLFFGEDEFDGKYSDYKRWAKKNCEGFDPTRAASNASAINAFIKSNIDASKDPWKNKQADFIGLLKDYEAISFLNEDARKKYFNTLINANEKDPLHCFYEIIQNADDCIYENEDRALTVDFSQAKDNDRKVVVSYNEAGMTFADVIALTSFNESNKTDDPTTIGEKGQGFKTVFKICDTVEVMSGGFAFKYVCTHGNNSANIEIEKIETDENHPETNGTMLILHLRDGGEGVDEICKKLLEKYGVGGEVTAQAAFSNCPIMFTNKINSMTIISTDAEYTIKNTHEKDDIYTISCGDVSVKYLRYESKVEFDKDDWYSRYEDKVPFDKEKAEQKIVIAAALDTENITSGKLYTYLPTAVTINAPLNIHFPAFLDNSRDHLGTNSDWPIAWNTKLIKDFYDKWYKDFFEQMKKSKPEGVELTDYITENGQLFDGLGVYGLRVYDYEIDESEYYKNLKLFKPAGSGEWKTGADIWMPDEFASKFSEALHSEMKLEKTRAEYCPKFIIDDERKELTGYCDPEVDDDKLIDALNAIMTKTKEICEKIRDYIQNDKKTIYLPKNDKNKLRLNVFRCDNNTKSYQAVDEEKEVWVYSETPAAKDSFIRVSRDELLVKLKVIRENDPPFGEIVRKTGKLSNKDFYQIRQIFEYFAEVEKSTTGWYEYAKQFLVGGQASESTPALAELMNNCSYVEDNDELNSQIYTLMVLYATEHKNYNMEIPSEFPPAKWTKELVDAVITADRGKSGNITVQWLNENAKARDEVLFKDYQSYDEFQDLYVLIAAEKLPEGVNFLHFNKRILLRNKEVVSACAESIRKGLPELVKSNEAIADIITRKNSDKPFKDTEAVEELGKLLQINLTYGYHISIEGLTSNEDERKPEVIYGKNIIAYELVQNVNDCHGRGDDIGETLEIQNKNGTLTLSYPDAGFTPKDLVGLCGRHNTGKNDDSNSTGKKGTGFKSLYRCYEEVTVKSNFFELTLSRKEHPKYTFIGGDLRFPGGWVAYKKNPRQPIPSFTYPDENSDEKFDGITTLTLTGGNGSADDFPKLCDFRTYLFTDKINEITVDGKTITKTFSEDGKTLTVNDGGKKYSFYKYSYEQTDENIPEKDRLKVTLLFPADDETKKAVKGEPNIPIYCALPLFDTKIPEGSELCFYMNAPSLKLPPDRRSPDNSWEIKRHEGLIKAAFEAFAKEHPQIAYKYFPTGKFYECYNGYGIVFTDCGFIPVEEETGFISLNDLKTYEGKLDYEKKEDFAAVLRLCALCVNLNNSTFGKLLLRHCEKYKAGVSPKTPIQTVVEADIEGYSRIEDVKAIISEKFGVKEIEFSIGADMFDNVRGELFLDSKMDEFAKAAIVTHILPPEFLFDKAKKLNWSNEFLKIFSKEEIEYFRDNSFNISKQKPFMSFEQKSDKKYDDFKDILKEYERGDANKDFVPGKTVADLFKEAIYYNAPKSFKAPLYFWSKEEKLVIFGQEAVRRLAEKVFKLQKGKEVVKISPPVYSLPKIRGSGFSEELVGDEFVKVSAAFAKKSKITLEDWHPLLYRTDFGFDDENGGKAVYHWKGYGAPSKDKETVCPVCKSSLMSAIEQLGVHKLKTTNDKITLPLIMCKSCAAAFGENTVYLYKSKEERKEERNEERIDDLYEYLKDNSMIRVKMYYSCEGSAEERAIVKNVTLTTPHRLLIYHKYFEREDSE